MLDSKEENWNIRNKKKNSKLIYIFEIMPRPKKEKMTLINVSLKKPKNKLKKISKLHHWDCRNKKIKVMKQ